MSRFDIIKSCETPEEMALELNKNERRFCPMSYKVKPEQCEKPCGKCISEWLCEEAE